MRYQVTAHLYDHDAKLAKACRLEVDAAFELDAHNEAIARLRNLYPDMGTIAVTAEEVDV